MPAKTGISHEELRRVNTSALLTWVHHHGPTTRARLTHELGLNRSTIGDLTSQLEETGLVEELPPDQISLDGERTRRSGRPSLVVSPRFDVGVLAVMLDVDRIVTGIVGLGGELHHRRERLHQPGTHDVGPVVDSAAQMCREVLSAVPDMAVLGVGVSVPGLVRVGRRAGALRAQPGLDRRPVRGPAGGGARPPGRGRQRRRPRRAGRASLRRRRGCVRGRLRRRHRRHRRWVPGPRTAPAGRRGVRRRGRPSDGRQRGDAVPVRLARLLGDQDRRQPSAPQRPDGSPAAAGRRSRR